MKNVVLSLLITCLVNGFLFWALIKLNRHDAEAPPVQAVMKTPVIIREPSPTPPFSTPPLSAPVPETTVSPLRPPLEYTVLDILPPRPTPIMNRLFQPPATPLPSPLPAPTTKQPVEVEKDQPTAEQTVRVPYDVGDLDAPPRDLGNAAPAYPQIARSRHIEGSVTVKLLIDTTGRVKESWILEVNGHPSFGRAVSRIVESWRFSVPMHKGKPVEVWAVKTINFRLN